MASSSSTARSRCPAGARCKARVEATGKPLAGVLVTHAHPDHYGGLVELGDVPIYAVAGVADVIRRDDDAKEQILRPMFGDEWPTRARVPEPDRGRRRPAVARRARVHRARPRAGRVAARQPVAARRRPQDRVLRRPVLQPHARAIWPTASTSEWLEHIATLRGELPGDALLHPGHGDPAGPELLDWQRGLHPHVRGRGPARRLVRPRAGQGVRGRSRRRVPAEPTTCGS